MKQKNYSPPDDFSRFSDQSRQRKEEVKKKKFGQWPLRMKCWYNEAYKLQLQTTSNSFFNVKLTCGAALCVNIYL